MMAQYKKKSYLCGRRNRGLIGEGGHQRSLNLYYLFDRIRATGPASTLRTNIIITLLCCVRPRVGFGRVVIMQCTSSLSFPRSVSLSLFVCHYHFSDSEARLVVGSLMDPIYGPDNRSGVVVARPLSIVASAYGLFYAYRRHA